MTPIVECVPNFSEGRNRETIEAIAEAIRSTSGCRLLDVDPGQATNRTVITFVGDPEAVVAGALNAARVARDRIDMRAHTGEHPRLGAMDVCPFVPVAGTTMAQCVEVAREFARRLGQELEVPVYLYEAAAQADYRRSLPQIRAGEYEGLAQKLADPRWQPDAGPAVFDARWGATVTGARNFLIAYNVNILGTASQAHRIALNLREAGRGPEQPGRLKAVKGLGWYVDEYGLAQVTVNLTDYHATPIHVLFEAVREEAAALNVGVAGSEIVGLVPMEAMLLAAEHYIDREDLFIYEERQKIRLVVERLGLNSVAAFDPQEKIVELLVAEPLDEPLAGSSLRQFIESVADRTSAPGGGSASAAIAALGAALGAMVAKLTYGVRKFETVDRQMRAAIVPLQAAVAQLIPMIDADTTAFNDVMDGLRMPKDTPSQRSAREEKIQAGLKTAIEVPLTAMRLADGAWEAMCLTARYGNPASKSDLQVGAKALETGIWGAFQNVCINLTDVTDDAYRRRTLEQAEAMRLRAADKCAKVQDILSGR
jgi:glutamate formiminotransferase/formiminotetrahydrofolate cyclodeaminase